MQVPSQTKGQTAVIPSPQDHVVIIRRTEVERITGLTCHHIYQLMRKGRFPRQIHLGERSVGWIKSEVLQWVADRVKMRRPPRRLSLVRTS